MNYTTSESLEQVLSRREQLKKKRDRRRLGWYSLSVCAILLVLTLTVASMPLTAQDAPGAESMGSFMLEAKTGGIVAAVVLAFLLGVIITLLCIRQKRNKPQKESPLPSQNDKNGGRSK